MRVDMNCLAYAGVALLIGYIGAVALLGFVGPARGQRQSRLLAAEVPNPTEGHAANFARGYRADERQERRIYPEGERLLQGYRKQNRAGSDTDSGGTSIQEVVEEEGMEMEEEIENEEKRGGGKRAREKNGPDGDESIAEMMSGIQLKFRPSNMPEERTQSIGIVEANPFPYNYPKIRYVPWHDLSKETKDIVEEEFGYNVVSWNYMSHIVESNAFSTFDAKQQKSLLMLGIDENVWDCFINREYY